MPYSNTSKKIVQEMGDFLETTNWTSFATLTTTYPINLKQSRRLMEKYHKYLVESGLKPTIFWITEPFYSNTGHHIHLLIKIGTYECVETLLKALRRAWILVSKGSSILEKTTLFDPYCKDKGANYYVAKYICSGNIDFDFFRETDWF